MADVTLYGALACPLSKRVEIALKLKGVQYDYIEEDMFKPSPWLLMYNPLLKSVPVLLHNGDPIIDFIVILEYIDETWKGNHFVPQDSKERANARFWAKFIESKCIPALMAACWGKQMVQKMATADACECLKTLESELGNKKFFGGNTLGLVDIVAGFMPLWLGVIEEVNGVKLLTRDKFPILDRWADSFVNSSIVKENLPPRDQLLAFYRANKNFFQPGNAPPMMPGAFPGPPR